MQIDETNDTGHSLADDLDNPNLFEELDVGDYEYGESEIGKYAYGHLNLDSDTPRNPTAQRTVGGEDRLDTDDGGHLIGNRFGGSGDMENLEPQSSNLNRSAYKIMENSLAESIGDGDDVVIDVETYHPEGSNRPDSFMGYTVSEDAEGNRDWDTFSFENLSTSEMDELDAADSKPEHIDETDADTDDAGSDSADDTDGSEE